MKKLRKLASKQWSQSSRKLHSNSAFKVNRKSSSMNMSKHTICDASCLPTPNIDACHLLIKPLLNGWQRFVSSSSRRIVYKTPCGRRISNQQQLHRYLRATNCEYLDVAHFNFHKSIDCRRHFVSENGVLIDEASIDAVSLLPLLLRNIAMIFSILGHNKWPRNACDLMR